jgi:hypothetical protein
MGLTVTAIGQPTHIACGLGFRTYNVACDNSHAANGEAMDLSATFKTIIAIGVNDLVPVKTQKGYKFAGIADAKTGGIDPATLKLAAYRAAGTGAVFDEADTSDLSVVGAAVPIIVFGVLC